MKPCAIWTVLLLSAFAPVGQAQDAARTELVVAPRGDSLPPLDSHFLGFSYEKSKLASPFFTGTNEPLIALFQQLGSGVLRIGANAVDKTHWNLSGPGLTAGEIAPSDVDRLAKFGQRTGWKIYYGLNFASNTPQNLVSEAVYAARVLGDRLEGFELGNEPDLYSRNGLRPPSFAYADFRREWETYAAAIRAALPSAVLIGPSTTTGVDNFNRPFSQDEAARVALLTHHYYRGDGQSPGSTVELLLGGDPHLEKMLADLGTNAKGIPGGFRLAEANSFYNGGAPGVSNAFAAALWSLDFLFQNALQGSRGVNFHGGNGPGSNGGVPDEHAGGGYTPIADDGKGNVVSVRPVYYGMALFGRAAHGKLLDVQLQNPVPGLAAYAVKSAGGGLLLVLINKSRSQAVQVLVHADHVVSKARSLGLTAPALESASGYALGGAPIEKSGDWAGHFAPVAVKADGLPIDVPAASAVLVETE